MSSLFKPKNRSLAKGGFSLIELMIVVAIIGILSSIALPVYQEYAANVKISEGIQLATAAKVAISETGESLGTIDGNRLGFDFPVTGTKFVKAITVSSGVWRQAPAGDILIAYRKIHGNPDIPDGSSITLRPLPGAAGSGVIEWNCFGLTNGGTFTAGVTDKYLPGNCRK